MQSCVLDFQIIVFESVVSLLLIWLWCLAWNWWISSRVWHLY